MDKVALAKKGYLISFTPKGIVFILTKCDIS